MHIFWFIKKLLKMLRKRFKEVEQLVMSFYGLTYSEF